MDPRRVVMTPDDLLAAATTLIHRPDTLFTGIWPRAAALLARQALEGAMAELWASKPQAADMSSCTTRSQLLCLTAYLNPVTARRAAYLLATLSHACHYHPYELTPTAAELTSWLTRPPRSSSRSRQRVARTVEPVPVRDMKFFSPNGPWFMPPGLGQRLARYSADLVDVFEEDPLVEAAALGALAVRF